MNGFHEAYELSTKGLAPASRPAVGGLVLWTSPARCGCEWGGGAGEFLREQSASPYAPWGVVGDGGSRNGWAER